MLQYQHINTWKLPTSTRPGTELLQGFCGLVPLPRLWQKKSCETNMKTIWLKFANGSMMFNEFLSCDYHPLSHCQTTTPSKRLGLFMMSLQLQMLQIGISTTKEAPVARPGGFGPTSALGVCPCTKWLLPQGLDRSKPTQIDAPSRKPIRIGSEGWGLLERSLPKKRFRRGTPPHETDIARKTHGG